MEYANQVKRTGSDPGLSYMPLGNPPNYYVSVLNVGQSLPYVQVGNNIYGAYSGSDYGKYTQDQIYLIPRQIEASILGLLNDFLGRGSFSNNGTTTSSSSRSRSNANEGKFVACTTTADCGGNSYCNQNGDYAVCSGGLVCVCSRAHYHLALDEALEPAPNNYTGYFIVRDDDEGISAMYTEPNWLSTVGVTVYREAGPEAGTYAIIAGGVTLAASVVASIALRATLSKSRLY